MKIAFCLFHYFPYGGLEKDFLRVAKTCHQNGHEISVFTTNWQGEKPDFINLHLIPAKGLSSHKRMWNFAHQTTEELKKHDFDLTIGFNKIPGLDIYYAADICFSAQPKYQNSFLRRLTSRYRMYSSLEEAIFNKNGKTTIILLSDIQKKHYQTFYHTQEERLHLLPPGINKKFIPNESAQTIRETYREELGVPNNDFMLISIGACFFTKGIDRALHAFAKLPENLKKHSHYFIVGENKNIKRYKNLTKALKIDTHVHFLGFRNDIEKLLLTADLNVHLARNESAGYAILESLVSGCPILVTENCGFAPYIKEANAGEIVNANASNDEISQQLRSMLAPEKLAAYKKNALNYSATADLFSLEEKAVEIIESFITK